MRNKEEKNKGGIKGEKREIIKKPQKNEEEEKFERGEIKERLKPRQRSN